MALVSLDQIISIDELLKNSEFDLHKSPATVVLQVISKISNFSK